ncbi:hypothetical protein H2204_006580 [Knufia peltigerae]|uniref:Uncharacterized protein n=1 Tax=Knufia peltigerae TaxID=1002370 RepID=A0AA39CYR0_9EURO|nr:hypothetical protein H2204_006580 [Knufia peltigerae]
MDNRVTISESELSSLYERYPEIKFEINEEPLVACSQFSSPCSNDTDGDTSQLSAEAESTPCTTPSHRGSHLSDCHDGDAILDFLDSVRRANLPDSCRNGFSNLTKLVDNLSHLFPSSTDQHFEIPDGLDNQEILLHSEALLEQLQQVNLNVEEQVNSIAFVRGLAPFQVNPTEQDLWTNYRQKVQLIVQ